MENINNIKSKFEFNLDLFRDNYVAHLVNPDYEPNIKLYTRDKNNLNTTIKELFFLRNSLEKKNDKLDKTLQNLFEKIEQHKEMNEKLEQDLKNLGDGDLAAIKMSKDAIINYKWSIFYLVLHILLFFSLYGIFYYQKK